jgi:hypothetical protein
MDSNQFENAQWRDAGKLVLKDLAVKYSFPGGRLKWNEDFSEKITDPQDMAIYFRARGQAGIYTGDDIDRENEFAAKPCNGVVCIDNTHRLEGVQRMDEDTFWKFMLGLQSEITSMTGIPKELL